MFAILALVAVSVLTLKFAVSEGLIERGRIGGGMEVKTFKGRRVTVHTRDR